MEGPWGIKTHNRWDDHLSDKLVMVAVITFPIWFTLLMLWLFGKL